METRETVMTWPHKPGWNALNNMVFIPAEMTETVSSKSDLLFAQPSFLEGQYDMSLCGQQADCLALAADFRAVDDDIQIAMESLLALGIDDLPVEWVE